MSVMRDIAVAWQQAANKNLKRAEAAEARTGRAVKSEISLTLSLHAALKRAEAAEEDSEIWIAQAEADVEALQRGKKFVEGERDRALKEIARKDEAIRKCFVGSQKLVCLCKTCGERLEAALSPDPTWLKDREERIAAFCHSQWSGWMKYLFSKSTFPFTESKGCLIPGWATARWIKQMETKYEDLSEEEKESDRKEARGFFKALRG